MHKGLDVETEGRTDTGYILVVELLQYRGLTRIVKATDIL